MKHLVYIFTALALICGAKLHLPALQVVAWTGMVVKYSQDNDLAEALAMTFDGDHPCPLCKVIRKAQTGDQQEMKAPSLPDHSPWALTSSQPWIHTLCAWSMSAPRADADYVSAQRPPVPPPRTTA